MLTLLGVRGTTSHAMQCSFLMKTINCNVMCCNNIYETHKLTPNPVQKNNKNNIWDNNKKYSIPKKNTSINKEIILKKNVSTLQITQASGCSFEQPIAFLSLLSFKRAFKKYVIKVECFPRVNLLIEKVECFPRACTCCC